MKEGVQFLFLLSLLVLLLQKLAGYYCQSEEANFSPNDNDKNNSTESTISVNISNIFHPKTTKDGDDEYVVYYECKYDCHVYYGVGGLSGGGSTSRLLIDYPKQVRDEILDFLFLPNFGASLQILKVEIGSDVQSTDGSEATHMRSPNLEDLNFQRGYEWWLLKEAKKRNPNIITYGLPWAFPGWISTEIDGSPFHNLDRITNYVYQWVKGAHDVHNITIDYLGIWNEIGTNREYVFTLRRKLDENGFTHVKLVSNDGQPGDILPHLINNTNYRNVIDVFGFHYPREHDFDSYKLATSFDKPIWSSEDSSSYGDLNGACCWARNIISHYVLNNITANIMWNLVGSYIHGTNWYGSSMLLANQPWTTAYYNYKDTLMPVVWVTAHYTQFIQLGWNYLPVGSGSGELQHGGYYMTLVSPTLEYFTIVVVKISRDHASCTRPELWDWETNDEFFHINIQLPTKLAQQQPNGNNDNDDDEIQTWYSNLEQEETRLFEKLEPTNNGGLSTVTKSVDDKDGFMTFDITLNVTVGSVFTVTNQPKNVGHKGQPKTKSKPDPFFPVPYFDEFNNTDNYDCDDCYTRYLSDQQGAFEIQTVDAENYQEVSGTTTNETTIQRRRALVQMTPQLPVMYWLSQRPRGPVSIIGMTEWEDIEVEISFRLPNTYSSCCVSTRTGQHWLRGITFCTNTTHWFVQYGGANLTGYDTSSDYFIADGNHDITPNAWHTMSLSTAADHAECCINKETVLEATIRVGDSGFAAIGVDSYAPVQYGYLHVKPVGPSWTKPTPTAISDSFPWSLSVAHCTPNGYSMDSEQFELTANWQILHLPSRLCVTVLERDKLQHHTTEPTLTLDQCRHDFPPQRFRHDYTRIRNVAEYPLKHELGDLCATQDGRVSLTVRSSASSQVDKTQESNSTVQGVSCAGANSYFFAKWALYPNTHQLRNSFGYQPWLGGGRALCLQATTVDRVSAY